jgi:histidine triad (HIT) family protein
MSADPECIFCRIVAGDIPATIVTRTDRLVAFRDLNPQAPTHLLVVPVDHYPNAGSMAQADPALAADLLGLAAKVAADEGVGDAYRLVFNTGAEAGQSVFHAHLHLLGGRRFGWPPG